MTVPGALLRVCDAFVLVDGDHQAVYCAVYVERHGGSTLDLDGLGALGHRKILAIVEILVLIVGVQLFLVDIDAIAEPGGAAPGDLAIVAEQ